MIKSIFSALSIVALMSFASTAFATIVIKYDASVTPDHSTYPFNYLDGVNGTRVVNSGILTMNVTGSSGSINNVRNDSLTSDDTALFEFRTKLNSTDSVSPGVIPGAVVHLRWSGQSGALYFFIKSDGLQLSNGGGLNGRLNFFAPLDTSIFHTYTILKDTNTSIKILTDGNLTFEESLSIFDTGFSLDGWQSFSNNPASSTSWDFFNYAIGPDAVNALAVPETETYAMMLAGLGLMSFVANRRKV